MDENDRTLAKQINRPLCCACGRPLRTGEPHWAGDRQGRPWHYGCAERAGLTYSWFPLRAVRALAEDGAFPAAVTAPAEAAAPG